MSCCPEGSWPALQVDYQGNGSKCDIGDGLQAYVTGEVANKAILMIPDVFGICGGRNQGIADGLAAKGYFVVLVDVFRGNPLKDLADIGTWLPAFPYSLVKGEIQIALRFLTSKGVDRIGLMGFCYGCWINFHLCGDKEMQENFTCGVNCHPSLIIEEKFFQKDPVALADPVTSPQLLLSASNDPPFVQEGGGVIEKLAAKSFGKDCQCVNFPKQNHGWVNRGDVSIPEVKEDVKRAISLATEFFQKHV